jgi:hypothetical protein
MCAICTAKTKYMSAGQDIKQAFQLHRSLVIPLRHQKFNHLSKDNYVSCNPVAYGLGLPEQAAHLRKKSAGSGRWLVIRCDSVSAASRTMWYPRSM